MLNSRHSCNFRFLTRFECLDGLPYLPEKAQSSECQRTCRSLTQSRFLTPGLFVPRKYTIIPSKVLNLPKLNLR